MTRMQDLTPFIVTTPPPLDPAWRAHEEAAGLLPLPSQSSTAPQAPPLTTVERQPIYASQCRARNTAMMALGARDHDLSLGIRVSGLSVPSRLDQDEFEIPVLRYELLDEVKTHSMEKGLESRVETADDQNNDGQKGAAIILVYIHGGGLIVGEADSEELSCRRLVKRFTRSSAASASELATDVQSQPKANVKLYSIGYRLMPQVSAQTCLSDVRSAFEAIQTLYPNGEFVLIGSSSGGELAALLSQSLPPGTLHGILLRCPVTVDAPEHVPSRFREWHTSASPSFVTSLLGLFSRQVPRDGLARMPLECPVEEVRELDLPRTWIQVCTNDVLYSDGLCYARLLQDGGVHVEVDVVGGWPHTFWLKAPHLDRALEADEAMLRGLAWVLGG